MFSCTQMTSFLSDGGKYILYQVLAILYMFCTNDELIWINELKQCTLKDISLVF